MAERPALLLVHGFPLDSRMWRHQAEALSDSFQVLTPDLPGHGVNATGQPAADVDAMARFLAAQMDDAGVERVHLAGFSMGGYVCFAFMHHFGHRVLSLALVDTRATADTEAGREARGAMAAQLRSDGARAAADAMLPPMFTAAVPEPVRGEAERWMLDQAAETLVADVGAMRDRPDSTTILPGISVPTLVLVGDQDPISPPADAGDMAAAIRGARLVTISDAAHLTPVEQPEQVTGALRAFLTALG
ncbi:MAG: alpha/beta fold hydrolase [Candidatus Dormibacteria bacterium]